MKNQAIKVHNTKAYYEFNVGAMPLKRKKANFTEEHKKKRNYTLEHFKGIVLILKHQTVHGNTFI